MYENLKLSTNAIIEIWKYVTLLSYLLFKEHVINEKSKHVIRNPNQEQISILQLTINKLTNLDKNNKVCNLKMENISPNSVINLCVCSAIINIIKSIIIITDKNLKLPVIINIGHNIWYSNRRKYTN